MRRNGGVVHRSAAMAVSPVVVTLVAFIGVVAALAASYAASVACSRLFVRSVE
jgi:hypothetical protein